MSENQQNETAATPEVQPSEAVTVEMTKEKYDEWERKVQLGITDELPDGRKVKDVQAEMEKLQLKQAEEIAATAVVEKVPATTLSEVAPEEMVTVTIQPNGLVSAAPVVETTAPAEIPNSGGDASDADTEAENDLPSDLPGREKLIAAGVVSLEVVAKMTLEDLQEINGVGGKTAQAILNYGKGE